MVQSVLLQDPVLRLRNKTIPNAEVVQEKRQAPPHWVWTMKKEPGSAPSA